MVYVQHEPGKVEREQRDVANSLTRGRERDVNDKKKSIFPPRREPSERGLRMPNEYTVLSDDVDED
jgi:hypothetical protein